MRRESGFTLIEILITVSLLAFVSLALYTIFDSGIRVMRKVSRPISEENIDIFLEKLSQDLQNLFRYKTIPFRGEAGKLEFPTTVPTVQELGFDQGLGRVTYLYDERTQTIYRRQENVSEMYLYEKEGEGQIKERPILSSIYYLNFQYYGMDPFEKVPLWQEAWEENQDIRGIPQAVKVALTIEDSEGTRHDVTRTISIPVAG